LVCDLKGLKNFYDFTFLLDEFNESFGLLTFFSVLGAITWISCTAFVVLIQTSNLEMYIFVAMFIGYVPFTIFLLSTSHVQNMVSECFFVLMHVFLDSVTFIKF